MATEHSERRLADGRIVYDPRGSVTAEPQALSPRLDSLTRIRLGILDNTKWNASKLLRETVAQLRGDTTFADVRRYAKESFSRTADPGLLDRIARETDAVITAIGD